MRDRLSFAYAALLLLCLLAPGGRAAAQEADAPKFEVGAHFSALPLDDNPSNNSLCAVCGTFVYAGLGGRLTYNLTDGVALDSELNFFSRENESFRSRRVGGRAVQGLFGVKAGRRFERVGVFAKARPGFLSFGETIAGGFGSIPATVSRKTHFNVDLGGVVEFYPSRRFLVRVDAGDTIVRYGEENLPGALSPVSRADTRHNFQFSTGVAFRF